MSNGRTFAVPTGAGRSFRLALLAGCVLLACSATGCVTTEPAEVELERLPAEKAEMLAYYLPTRIDILPFTRFASFDDDEVPDGVVAVIRPVDVLGDPVKAYGTLRFELYEFRKASALKKGRRLAVWQRTLASPVDQKKYWDRVTQTYQFQLAWPQPLVPNRMYVLEVTCELPTGVRLFSDHVLEFAVSPERIKQQLKGQSTAG